MTLIPPASMLQDARDTIYAAIRAQSPQLAHVLEGLPLPPAPQPPGDDAAKEATTRLTQWLAGGSLAWSADHHIPNRRIYVFWVETVDDGTVHVGFTQAPDGRPALYAAGYDNLGERRWAKELSGSLPYPLLQGRPVAALRDRVAIALIDFEGRPVTPDLLCLKAADGEELWRQAPEPTRPGYFFGAAADKGAGLFLAAGIAVTDEGQVGTAAAALDAEDGTVRWTHVYDDPDGPILAIAAATAPDAYYLGGAARPANAPAAAKLNPADGTKLWQTSLGEPSGLFMRAFPRPEGLLLGGVDRQDGFSALIETGTGTPVWFRRTSIDGPASLGWDADPAGRRLFEVGQEGTAAYRSFVLARSAASGEVLWQHRDSALTEPDAGWVDVKTSADGDDIYLAGYAGEDGEAPWYKVTTARLNAAAGNPVWIGRHGDDQTVRVGLAVALADSGRLVVVGGGAEDKTGDDLRAIAVAHHAAGLLEQTVDASKEALPKA